MNSWPICDVIVKKNLLPLPASLSTHMLPVNEGNEALGDGQPLARASVFLWKKQK